MRILPAIAAALLAGALAARDVYAAEAAVQPTEPTAEDVEKARDLFEKGLEAYDEEKYAQALVLFLDSYDLNPLDELLYNIAFCYEQIGQDPKAIDYYRRYLDTLPEDEEKDRAKVMAKIEELEGGSGEGVEEKSLKERVTGKYRGDWMHGLVLGAAFDMDPLNPNPMDIPDLEVVGSGLGFRGGYNLRLLGQKLLLGTELGFLSIGTYDQHKWSFIIDLNLGGRVGSWVGGSLQLYVGGRIDLKWYFARRSVTLGVDELSTFSLGVGPYVRLFWHWSERIGMFFELGGVVGIIFERLLKHHMPVHGYIILPRLGIFFGLA